MWRHVRSILSTPLSSLRLARMEPFPDDFGREAASNKVFFHCHVMFVCVWPARSGTGTDGDWGRNCGGIWSGEDCSFCGWKPYDMAVLLFGWWVRAIPSMQIKMPFWPLGGALSQLMMDHSVKCSWVELRLVRLVTSVLFQWQKAPNAIEYKAHGRFLFL